MTRFWQGFSVGMLTMFLSVCVAVKLTGDV